MKLDVVHGALPYHHKELGAGNKASEIELRTGLLALALLVFNIMFAMLTAVVATPFLLLGCVEVVWAGPSNYRVRWRRD